MRVRLFDQRCDDVGHVEKGREQIVREVAVADHAVDLDDLLHHGQAEPLGDPTFDLAEHGQRIECPSHVLRRGDLDDLHEAQLGIDVDDGAMGHEGERRVAVALAVLVEIFGRRMAVLDGLVDHDAGARLGDRNPPTGHRVENIDAVDGQAHRIDIVDPPDMLEQPLAHGSTRRVHRSPAHPGLSRGRCGSGRADLGVDAIEHDVVDAENRAGDLRCDRDEPLADFRRGELQRDHPVGKSTPGRRVVVEPFGVHQVLDGHTPADAADDVAALGGATGATRQSHHVDRSVVHEEPADGHVRQRQRRRVADAALDRRNVQHRLAGDQRVAGAHRIAQPDLDRVETARHGQLVHLRFVCETRLNDTEPSHRPARQVVGAHGVPVDDGVRAAVRTLRVRDRIDEHRRRRRGVGPTVEHHARLDLDDLTIGGR